MAQKLIQSQEQRMQQVQRLSQQQMLQVRLIEMPLAELEDNVKAELDDNPALEVSPADEASDGEHPRKAEEDGNASERDGEDFDDAQERENRESALDDALASIGRDDEMPAPSCAEERDNADYEERVWGDTVSFYDKLKEQAGEIELTEEQGEVMEYIIGSLDSDGLLRKSSETICDELAVYHNIIMPVEEIDALVKKLQTFEPAGIGARSLQECLLLQIARRADGKMKSLMLKVVESHFEAFTKKHWEKLRNSLGIDDMAVRRLQEEMRKLNPKPGSALGETQGSNAQQITPDFIVETDDDGTVSFSLNMGDLPELKVSPSFTSLIDTYRNNKGAMSRRDKEALLYAKEKVARAQGYIEAIRQRRRTLAVTMQAIIDWQKDFFLDGDEADLRPMILKNIADKTGLDISTVSRVSNVKYAQTNWGTFPLRFFFTDSYTTGDGAELSTRKIKLALKEIIDSEDKSKPMSDEALTREMKLRGCPVARRTIAKYREQLGIPVARLRK